LHIEKLKVNNLRNIVDAEIFPHKKLNYLFGDNGAGKTTLLESIYLLARAKSFRQSQNRTLIANNSDELIVFAELVKDNQTKVKIGLSKNREKPTVLKNRQNINKLSQLASVLPISVITPNIQRIIEEGPSYRRKLINWGMFHVEQNYAQLAQRYKKIINQRNKALNADPKELAVWSEQLALIGEEISKLQIHYLEKWNRSLNKINDVLDETGSIELNLKQGWRKGIALIDALKEQSLTDRERGYTTSGPHRLDIKISVDGKDVKNFSSRGQNKMLAIKMLLAQTNVMQESNGETPILLFDDIESELDKRRYAELHHLLQYLDVQTFITTINDMKGKSIKAESERMFHVEHGKVHSC
jgi:DNA replication and repair protein RecF